MGSNGNGLQPVYLVGDVRDVLKTLAEKSVQTVITSPPYWGLRDYGVEGQLGLEDTPERYVENLVEIFREVKRVLRDDGTLWLNLGDSYANDGKWGGQTGGKHVKELHGKPVGRTKRETSLKPKDLVGIPWRVAFALQADGWYLRSDIIWSKPNPMPESVTDRPTKAHEYIFLMAKSKSYYYDADAIREDFADERQGNPGAYNWSYATDEKTGVGIRGAGGSSKKLQNEGWNADGSHTGRNKRTVWEVATKPYPGAHFAVFPDKLIEPCILAGSAPKACGVCGAPWARVVEKGDPINQSWAPGTRKAHEIAKGKHGATSVFSSDKIWPNITIGWAPTCNHNDDTGLSIVLDPFVGSGTTLLVSRNHGRASIGIDINPEYKALAEKRARLDLPDLFTFDEAEALEVVKAGGGRLECKR